MKVNRGLKLGLVLALVVSMVFPTSLVAYADDGGVVDPPPSEEVVVDEAPVADETGDEAEPVAAEAEDVIPAEVEPVIEAEETAPAEPEEVAEAAPEETASTDAEAAPADEEMAAPEVEGEETAAPEGESLVDVVEAMNENDVVLVDENGDVEPLATEEAEAILTVADPYIVRGGTTYRFLAAGGCAAYGGVGPTCVESATPIQAAIDFAANGETINIETGVYNENININKEVTLLAVDGAGTATIAGVGGAAVTVNANNVVIDGFTITNLTGTNAIVATDRSNITIQNNTVNNVGNTSAANVHAIAIVSNNAAVDNVVIQNNLISDITGNGKSATGIAAGWSTGDYDITGLLIQENTVTNVNAGRGAYGILINHGGGTTGETIGAQILNNTISNLTGLWAHAIGMEGNTPNAVVQGNDISDLTDGKTPSDAVGILFEANASGGTVTVSENTFAADVAWGVALHPNDLPGGANGHNYVVNADNNWWGAADGPSGEGPGTGAGVGPQVDYDPWYTNAGMTVTSDNDADRDGVADAPPAGGGGGDDEDGGGAVAPPPAGVGGIIPVTGGQLVTLGGVRATLQLSGGNQASFSGGVGTSVSVAGVAAETLPAVLPAGSSFVSGMSTAVFSGTTAVGTLPEGETITLMFDIPAGMEGSTFMVLFWDATANDGLGDWVEAGGEVVDGQVVLTVGYTGTFVLVTQ